LIRKRWDKALAIPLIEKLEITHQIKKNINNLIELVK